MLDIRSAHQRLHQHTTAAAAAPQHQGPSQPNPQAIADKVQQAAGSMSPEIAVDQQANEQLGTAAACAAQHCHDSRPILQRATPDRHCSAAGTSIGTPLKGRSKLTMSGKLEFQSYAAAATVSKTASELEDSDTSGYTAGTGPIQQDSCSQRLSCAATQLPHLSHDLDCMPSRAKKLTHRKASIDDADEASSSTAAANILMEVQDAAQPHQPATAKLPISMLPDSAAPDTSRPVDEYQDNDNAASAFMAAALHADGVPSTPACVGQDETLQRQVSLSTMDQQQPCKGGTDRGRYNVVLQGVQVWYDIDRDKRVVIRGANLEQA